MTFFEFLKTSGFYLKNTLLIVLYEEREAFCYFYEGNKADFIYRKPLILSVLEAFQQKNKETGNIEVNCV